MQVTDSNRRWLAEEEAWVGEMTEFQAYGKPLETVTPFKYLGRLLTATDDEWP